MRSALARSTRRRWRRSGCPGTGSAVTASPGNVYGTKSGPDGVSAMPSPRWPRREMSSRSVTHCPDEELAVPLATRDRRRKNAAHPPPEGAHKGGDILAHGMMRHRVPHDAFLGAAATDLELRLDEGEQSRRSARQGERGRQDELERDE